MFNVIVTSDLEAQETDRRLEMPVDRFGERSGFEIDGVSLYDPASMRLLERSPALLLREGADEDTADETVFVGKLRNVRVEMDRIAFRFSESGRLTFGDLQAEGERLNLGRWEFGRTHWSVKDGCLPRELLERVTRTPIEYDVAFSFASEDGEYADRVIDLLEDQGVRVYADRLGEVMLWGKDLEEHFAAVVRETGRHCVVLVSEHYARTVWSQEERREAFLQAAAGRDEFLLPARLDHAELPGLSSSVSAVSVANRPPEVLGDMVLSKLGRLRRSA